MQERPFSGFVLLTVAALLCFYSPCLFGQASFFYTDATFWLEPQCRFIAESLRSGHFPLWNPLTYCGMPQIAVTFPGLFYPVDYLFACFPFNRALALSMLFHQLVAVLSMYWFLRGLALPRRGAAGGAWLYGFSGYMFSLASNHSLVAGAAYLPLAAAGLHRLTCVEEPLKYRMMICSALSLTLLVSSGRPEVFAPSLAVIMLFLAFKYCSAKIDRSSLVWLLRAFFIALTLLMPMLLCTGEWLPLSRRGNGLLDREVFMYSAGWYDLYSMLCGPWLGDMRIQGSPARLLVCADDLPSFLSCAFIGPLALALALLGLGGGRKRLVYFSVLVLIVSSTFALGETTPIAPWLIKHVPVLSVVRFPVKLMFLPVFALAILAALGLESLLKDFNAERAKIASLTTGACAFIFLCCGGFYLAHPSALSPIGSGFLFSALVLVFMSVCCYSVGAGRLKASTLTALSLFGIFAGLLTNAFSLERLYAPSGFFAESSFVAERLKQYMTGGGDQGRYLNLCLERLTLPRSLVCGDGRKDIVEQFRYQRQILKPDVNIDFALPSSFGFEGSMKGDYYYYLLQTYFKSSQAVSPASQASDVGLSRFCEISGTAYLITQCYRNEKQGQQQTLPGLDQKYFQCLLDDRAANIRIYRHLGRHPQAWFTAAFSRCKNHNEVLDDLLGEAKTSLVSLPLLEDGAPGRVLSSTIANAPTALAVQRISFEKVEIPVQNAEDGLLVLADQNYPGWNVSVDGESGRICTVNGFMRGVFLNAGKHEVVFSYEPQSLKLALVIFVLGVSLAVYLGFQSRPAKST